MPRDKKLSYKGKLAEPLYADDYFRRPGLLADPDEVARRGKEDFRNELKCRMDLLFDHWDIDRADWASLAITLAIAHVPGFRREPQRKRTGPEQIWDSTTYTELLATVERLKQEKGWNDSTACRKISKLPDFANARCNNARAERPIHPY